MSAPHLRDPDNNPSLTRVLKAYGKRQPWPEELAAKKAADAVNGCPRDLDEPTESEVMPIEEDTARTGTARLYDTRPPSARFDKRSPEANRLDLLEELAVILRRITWSQMTEYCTGTGSDPKKVHEWSSK